MRERMPDPSLFVCAAFLTVLKSRSVVSAIGSYAGISPTAKP